MLKIVAMRPLKLQALSSSESHLTQAEGLPVNTECAEHFT